MKNIKKILSIILICALVLCSVPSKALAASKPNVTKKLSIIVGNQKTIKVKGKYIKSKKFKTNKKSIATVNKKGKVTGKKAGKATIVVTVKYKKTKKTKKYTTKKYICTVTVKENTPVVTEKPQVTNKPEVTNKPVTTPAITIKPEVTQSPVVGSTTEPVITPDTTKVPVAPEVPSVTDAPIVTDDVIVSEEPENTDTPVVTNEPVTPSETDIPSVTDEPVITDNPNITPEPTVETTPEPSEEIEYDYIFMNGTKERGVVWVQYPSTTQKGIYEWYDTQTNELKATQNVPVLDGYETIDGVECGAVIFEKATCTVDGRIDYYDLRTGKGAGSESIPATGHKSDEKWHTDGSEIWNKCVNCSNKLNRITVYNAGETTTHSEWITEPSETGGGVLGIYKGVNVYDMTEEEIESEYERYDVIFTDGTEDTFYGELVYYEDGSIRRFEVYAKSTSVLVGTIEYPSYEVVEIDLGNGEKTKVYGYYDREIANEMYELLNAHRAENGVHELTIFDKAQAMSDTRAAEFFYTTIYNQTKEDDDEGYPIHTRPDYTPYYTISTQECTLLKENEQTTTLISQEQESGLVQSVDLTAEYIFNNFVDSSEHDKAMLDAGVYGVGTSVFIGYPQNEDGTFKSYKIAITVQDFSYQPIPVEE